MFVFWLRAINEPFEHLFGNQEQPQGGYIYIYKYISSLMVVVSWCALRVLATCSQQIWLARMCIVLRQFTSIRQVARLSRLERLDEANAYIYIYILVGSILINLGDCSQTTGVEVHILCWICESICIRILVSVCEGGVVCGRRCRLNAKCVLSSQWKAIGCSVYVIAFHIRVWRRLSDFCRTLIVAKVILNCWVYHRLMYYSFCANANTSFASNFIKLEDV